MEERKNPYQNFDNEMKKSDKELEEERKNKIFVDGMIRNMKLEKYI